MNNKIEKAIKAISTLPQPEAVYAAKGEKLGPTPLILLYQILPNLAPTDERQTMTDGETRVIFTKGVMQSLTEGPFQSKWGIAPLNQIADWAIEKNYPNYKKLREDFSLYPIGGGECNVEFAIDSARPDLLNYFASNGLLNTAFAILANNEEIVTDTPNIARYLLGENASKVLWPVPGSTEAYRCPKVPALISVVQTGDSLLKGKWTRLSIDYPEAILLRSQLMLVIKNTKEDNVY